jgi:hypothetical protein
MSETDTEGLNDVRTRLAAAIGRDDSDSEASESEDREPIESAPSVTDLLGRAETDIEDLLAALAGRDTDAEEIRDDIDDLYQVIDEAKDLFDTIDHDDAAAAIDHESLSDAADPSEIVSALLKGDVTEAIEYGELFALIEFEELLDAVEVTDFLQNKGEFEGALEDFTADKEEDDDWLVLDMMKSLVERIGNDEDGSDSMTEKASDAMDASGSDLASLDSSSELTQATLQSKLDDAIENFRESALAARDRLKGVREQSREKVEAKTGGTGQPSSQNPTAYSTLPAAPDNRGDIGGVARFSTVPQTPPHSTAPGRDRIYGDRFERRREGRETNE